MWAMPWRGRTTWACRAPGTSCHGRYRLAASLLPGQPGDPNALGEAIARIEADLATIKAGIGDSGVAAVLARINEIYK